MSVADANTTQNPTVKTTKEGDTLDPFEQEVLDAFVEQAQRNGKEGDQGDQPEGGETTDDEVEAALEGEDGEEVDEEGDEEASGAPAQAAQEGTEVEPEGQTQPSTPDPSGASQSSSTDDSPDVYLGRPRSDIEAALQTYDWAKNLPPAALQGIDAYLSGAYVLVPADQAEAVGNASPSASAAPSDDNRDFLDDVDPDVAKRFREQQARLDALEATTAAQITQQQNEQQATLLQAIEVGGQEFGQTKELDKAELDRLMDSAARMATLTVGMQLYPSDPKRAVIHALDLAYLSDPDFRQREIDRRAAEQNEANRDLAARKRRAGSVTSAGGSVPKPTPTPPSKMTAPERDAAIADEIAQAMATR